MRRQLHLADLGDLLEQPLNAILATYRPSGEVLLTPVWHEWQDGGFSVVILAESRTAISNVTRVPVSWSLSMGVSTAVWRCGGSLAAPATGERWSPDGSHCGTLGQSAPPGLCRSSKEPSWFMCAWSQGWCAPGILLTKPGPTLRKVR